MQKKNLEQSRSYWSKEQIFKIKTEDWLSTRRKKKCKHKNARKHEESLICIALKIVLKNRQTAQLQMTL